MTTSHNSSTDQGNVPTVSVTELTPCALDFAQLLHARQKVEQRAQEYLVDLQYQIQRVLEQQGYQQVRFQRLDALPSGSEVAGAVTLLIFMQLPVDGLKDPNFRVQLPLVVTYNSTLLLKGAQINNFHVPEPFTHSLEADTRQGAELLVQGLSQRYMNHLLQSGGRSSLIAGANRQLQ
ncbi:hypothetical protein ACFFLM_00345 [Deinococcus oregonensis]|uniref:DUF302 domain-containing protein n=1 Tax=Deinococcus oregonensis TaxID=1805970 RepID=A0ABV6ATW9_9DEIO